MATMRNLRRTDDGRLLALTAGGVSDAFGVFYDRHERAVLAYFVRATRRADVAADLTAETFAAALQSAGRYDDGAGSARAWVFGIARHQLADAWRRGFVADDVRRALEIEALVLGDRELDAIEALLADETVDDLLAGLPAEQREAVVGRVLGDRGYSELAMTLRCSESVVRQRVSRGLRSLRARLEQTG